MIFEIFSTTDLTGFKVNYCTNVDPLVGIRYTLQIYRNVAPLEHIGILFENLDPFYRYQYARVKKIFQDFESFFKLGGIEAADKYIKGMFDYVIDEKSFKDSLGYLPDFLHKRLGL